MLPKAALCQPVDPGAGQQDIQVGDDARRPRLAGQRIGEPATHAGVGGDDDLWLENIVGPSRLQERTHGLQQIFQSAGTVDDQSMPFGGAIHFAQHCGHGCSRERITYLGRIMRYIASLDMIGGYGWTRTTDLSIMSAAL